VTGPILVVAYWLLGLPCGALAAFRPPWGSPAFGLLGLWLGMTLAVYLHFGSYLVLCFCGGRRCCRFSIVWHDAVSEARRRLSEANSPRGGADSASDAQPQLTVTPLAAHVLRSE
jgi:hypothetical protein